MVFQKEALKSSEESMHDETQDTTHPKMVTELFMEVLRSIGALVNVSHQRMNTREENHIP